MDILPTDDGSRTLFHDTFRQSYHSTHGARTEALHVFLEASGAADSLRAGEALRILEVGFGTGLNFLLTADLAASHRAPLHYVALERELLAPETLRALDHATLLTSFQLAETLYRWIATRPGGGGAGLLRCRLHDTLHLEVLLGDATATPIPEPAFDIVYHDAFSPNANPELWTPAFFTRLFAALKPGGRLATYSANGQVRRALVEVGFAVEKRPGPPGKREMTVALRP
jgi:tRNA U34 5-methylaminomethyl-2-thiouridine-forming methyltransferase MnmC